MQRVRDIFIEAQKQMFSPKTTLHIVMWSLAFVFLVIFDLRFEGFSLVVTLKNVVADIVLLAVLYYVNSQILIPDFLAKDKLFKFFSFLGLLTLSVSLLKILLHFANTKNIRLPNSEYVNHNLGHQFFEFFIAAGLFTIIKIVSDWVVQTKRKSELETRAFQSELNLLKSQINPHFLFNTLNSLYALTLKKSEVAPEIVLRLSEMMRYMLYECNIPLVPVSKEVDYIKNYLYLEKIRHAKIDVNFDVDVENDHLEVAPLIFMAFIENAFKHGAGNHIHAGHITIQLKTQMEQLYLTVENSRAEQTPMSNNVLVKSGGVGMVNVKRRLQLLYPNKHSLKIDETPHTYTVQLWLNLSNTKMINAFEANTLLAPSVQKMKILR